MSCPTVWVYRGTTFYLDMVTYYDRLCPGFGSIDGFGGGGVYTLESCATVRVGRGAYCAAVHPH
mgnify:CR=1 FL=1